MIFRYGEYDFPTVYNIMHDPSVAPWVRDDHTPDLAPESVLAMLRCSRYYLLGNSERTMAVLFAPLVSGSCFEIHTNILPEGRGEKAVRDGREMIKYMKSNTPCKTLMTWIPSFNRPALALARKLGFDHRGTLPKSFVWRGRAYDVLLFGEGE